jgi:hypothetical protein
MGIYCSLGHGYGRVASVLNSLYLVLHACVQTFNVICKYICWALNALRVAHAIGPWSM